MWTAALASAEPPTAAMSAAAWAPNTAVEALLTHQRPDGSWPPGLQVNPDAAGGITVGTTALACLALLDHWDLRPDRIRPAVQRGVDFVLGAYYRKPGSSRPGYGSPAWGQVYTVELLTRLLGHPAWRRQDWWAEHEAALRLTLDEAVDWLIQGQVRRPAEGRVELASWGYAGSFHAAAAIIALQHAKAAGAKVDPEPLRLAVTYLDAQRHEGKGYAYSQSGKYLDDLTPDEALKDGVGRLMACEWALRLSGRADPRRFEQAFEDFLKHRDFLWTAREAVTRGEVLRRGSASPYCWFAFFGYYYSTMALEGLPAIPRREAARRLKQDLLAVLNEDGTWTNLEMPKNPPPGSRIYSTAMGLMAMKRIEEALRLP